MEQFVLTLFFMPNKTILFKVWIDYKESGQVCVFYLATDETTAKTPFFNNKYMD